MFWLMSVKLDVWPSFLRVQSEAGSFETEVLTEVEDKNLCVAFSPSKLREAFKKLVI